MVARAHLKALKDGAGSSNVDAGLNTQWEETRKQARKLESEVDAELATFSKLGGAGASCHHVHAWTGHSGCPVRAAQGSAIGFVWTCLVLGCGAVLREKLHGVTPSLVAPCLRR